MKEFKVWLEELEQLEEGRLGLIGGLALGAASLFGGGKATAQQPPQQQQNPIHGFSIDELLQGKTNKQVDAGSEHISVWELSREDRIFVEAWGKLKEKFDNNLVEKSSHFQSVYIRIIKSEEPNKKMVVRVEVAAEIQAPDREQAKAMLINLLMRESGKLRMQHIMIKGLKQAHDTYPSLLQPEANNMQVHTIKMVITPNNATIY